MNSLTQTEIQYPGALQDTNTPGSMLFTVSGALVLVMLLIVALAWIARRCGFTATTSRGNNLLALKSTLSVGPRERVVVVEIENQWLVLGVSAAGIAMLATHEKESLQQNSTPDVVGDFSSMLKNLQGRQPEEIS